MEKQNNFLIHHIPLIIYGPVITVTILVVATLYELNFEYIGYFIAFILLTTLIGLYNFYKNNDKCKNKLQNN